MRLVVDTSALAALYIPEPLSQFAREAVEEAEELHFLDLAYYEFANVLRKRAARGEIPQERAGEILQAGLELISLSKIHRAEELIDEAFRLALRHNITVYDAALIAAAGKAGGRILTLDMALLRAVRNTELGGLFLQPPSALGNSDVEAGP